MLEGAEVGDPAVVGERRVLAHDGTVIGGGRALGEHRPHRRGSRLLSRGLSAAMELRRTCAARRRNRRDGCARFGGPLHANDPRVKEEIVRAIRRYFSDELGKRPLVIPYVTEV